VKERVYAAAAQGATLVATPENTFLMEERATPHPYTEENHPAIIAAKSWANELNIWLLIGSVAVLPSANAGDKAYNRSLLIDPAGRVANRYDKIHLFDADVPGDRSYRESNRFLAGDKAVIGTIDTPEPCLLGMTVCYDLRFPALYRRLAQQGAQVIAVPSAFTQTTGEAHWHLLLRARAIENGCFIIAPAQSGTHASKRKTYGHSLVIDPWGHIVAEVVRGKKLSLPIST
jgi:predicted amidohydrolase